MTAVSPRRRGRPALADLPAAPDAALLDRALEAFAERGFEGASVREIARECGLAVADNAAFSRIGDDWLGAAEQLALDLNSYTNNASLVLAFELSPGGKVLLFAADVLVLTRERTRVSAELLAALQIQLRTSKAILVIIQS